jgi:hypothetical protein
MMGQVWSLKSWLIFSQMAWPITGGFIDFTQEECLHLTVDSPKDTTPNGVSERILSSEHQESIF